MFPAFSKIQHKLEKFRKVYLNLVKFISLITFPMMLGFFVVAPEFINTVFGIKWQAAIPLIRILCFCGMVESVHTVVGGVILAQGRSDLQLKLSFIGTLFVTLAVTTGLRFGLVAVAIFYTLEKIIWAVYVQGIVNRLICLKQFSFYKNLANSMYIGICVLALGWLLKLFFSGPCLRTLSISLIGMTSAYLALIIIFGEVRFSSKKISIRMLE